jgi:hypothetical protein
MRNGKAKAWLRTDCPHSFKFLLFMAEARLLDQIEIIRCDPAAPDFERVKAQLAAATGSKATFPTVEIEPGRYKSDSEQLIEHYAATNGVDAGKLVALSFYRKGIYPQLERLH